MMELKILEKRKQKRLTKFWSGYYKINNIDDGKNKKLTKYLK